MRHKEKLLVRARHRVTTTAQSVTAIESTLQDMDAMIVSLDRRVAAEEMRTRITDAKHIAYSTVALAARVRSANLKKSLIELEAKRLLAIADHDKALSILSALEENQDLPQLVQLPLSNDATHATSQSKGRRRPRSYQRRTVIVFGPSNDNLASAAAIRTDATSTARQLHDLTT
jgi:flagellar protein FliJ